MALLRRTLPVRIATGIALAAGLPALVVVAVAAVSSPGNLDTGNNEHVLVDASPSARKYLDAMTACRLADEFNSAGRLSERRFR